MLIVSHTTVIKFVPMGVYHTENHPIELNEEEKERRRKQQERLDSEAWQADMDWDARQYEAEQYEESEEE